MLSIKLLHHTQTAFLMKLKVLVLLLAFTALFAACEKASSDFEMEVDDVVELKGFILKGISISGKVTQGCIANNDNFLVKRKGNEIMTTSTRILNIAGQEDPESFTGEARNGDYVTLYIPDIKEDDVKPGDILSSNITSCTTAGASI